MCSKDLTNLKKELKWLKEPDKDSLQKALKDLDMAYQKFFKEHTGYPKFKSKKNRYKSYRTSCNNNNIRFENKHIRLPKLGLVKVMDKQIPQGRILNATILQEPNGHYYCSLCCTDIEFIQIKSRKNLSLRRLDVQDLYITIILISEKKCMRMIKLHSRITCVLRT